MRNRWGVFKWNLSLKHGQCIERRRTTSCSRR